MIGVIFGAILLTIGVEKVICAQYEYINTTSSLNKLTISVCSSSNAYTMGIVRENLTWFQAQAACRANGYNTVDYASTNWPRRMHQRQFLQEENVNIETHWSDLHRLDSNSSTWCPYTRNSIPLDTLVNLLRQPNDDELCMAIMFNMSEPQESMIQFVPANCYKKNYYTCYSSTGDTIFQIYESYDLSAESSTVVSESANATSQESCLNQCSTKRCVGVLFRNDSLECMLLLTQSGNRAAVLFLEAVNENITVAGHTGCDVVTHSSSAFNPIVYGDDYSFDLSDCYIETTVPLPTPVNTSTPDQLCDAECECPNSTISDEEFEDMVKKLTVPKDQTSSYRRKLTCAEDNRSEVRTVAAIGLAFTAIVIGLPILLDAMTLIQHFKRGTQRVEDVLTSSGNTYRR